MGMNSWGVGASNFSIGRVAGGTSTNSAITILIDGKVGIDNITPLYLLDVNGDIHTSGSLRTDAGLITNSTTLVDNLNADLLDGQEGAYYLSRANHTGTLTVA